MKNEEGSHLLVLSVMLAHFDALQEIVVLSMREGLGDARMGPGILQAFPPRPVIVRGTAMVGRTSQ